MCDGLFRIIEKIKRGSYVSPSIRRNTIKNAKSLIKKQPNNIILKKVMQRL